MSEGNRTLQGIPYGTGPGVFGLYDDTNVLALGWVGAGGHFAHFVIACGSRPRAEAVVDKLREIVTDSAEPEAAALRNQFSTEHMVDFLKKFVPPILAEIPPVEPIKARPAEARRKKAPRS